MWDLCYSTHTVLIKWLDFCSICRYSFMRRNVRRLNREIGHHAASLTNPTAVIPLSVPTSYQPRKAYEKKGAAAAAAAAAMAASANLDFVEGGDGSAQGYDGSDGAGGAKPRKSSLKGADGGKKKGVRKAVNLAGKWTGI